MDSENLSDLAKRIHAMNIGVVRAGDIPDVVIDGIAAHLSLLDKLPKGNPWQKPGMLYGLPVVVVDSLR